MNGVHFHGEKAFTQTIFLSNMLFITFINVHLAVQEINLVHIQEVTPFFKIVSCALTIFRSSFVLLT